MPLNTTITPSAYEADRQARQQRDHQQMARHRTLQQHREDVERAIAFDRSAARTEEQIERFNDPKASYRNRVRQARRAFWVSVAVMVTYAGIWIADLLLATPDVAETLANKSMSLIASVSGATAEATSDGVAITPVWLRIGIGVLISSGFLALTAWIKGLSDERSQREATELLAPGDDAGYRRLRRDVWIKRAMKMGYMLILGGLLQLLYTFDVARARSMEEMAAMRQEEQEWEELGFTISGGVLETDEAIGGDPQNSSDTSGDTPGSLDLAKPSLVIYGVLFLLHGALLVAPQVGFGEDSDIAHFRRGAAQRWVDQQRDQEEPLLRNILLRINESEPEIRDALIREAQPLARRINEAAGRAVMEVPANPTGDSGGGESEAPPPADVEPTPVEPVDGGNSSGEPREEGNEPGSEAPEDYYDAIFGRTN